MAIARTGVFVDDYLEYSSTLPAELQRLLNTIRELDDRSQAMINQTRQQTKYCLGLASQGGAFSRRNEDEELSEKIRKEIEANQDNALSLCTEKVLLARQAHDLIDSHIKRLDEDLNNFAEDLKQEGKIAPDEPSVLPPLPLVPKSEKRKPIYMTPQSKRMDYRERDWDRERDRDFELMPPPGSLKKDFASPVELEQPIDPNEPTYCVCHQVSFGDMIACDNENCQGGEWFHYACVGLTPETRFKGKWYCPTCRQLKRRGWLRRQVFWMSKQILQLIMEDAIDDWLLRQIQWLRKEEVIAQGIKLLQDILWPNGRFFLAFKIQAKLNNDNQGNQTSQQGGKAVNQPTSFEQQLEAARRASDVKKFIFDGAPAPLVSLIGRKQYKRCARDIYYFLQSTICLKQLGYAIVELVLITIFPELRELIRDIHEKMHMQHSQS